MADNTASLRAIQNHKPHPAHHLVDELLQRIEALQRRHPGIDLTLRWVPGHKGIEGNELEDKEAKKAARGDSSLVEDLPGWLRRGGTVSKLHQSLNATMAGRAKEEWHRSPRAMRMDRIDERMPSKTYRKLVEKLPRRSTRSIEPSLPSKQYLQLISSLPRRQASLLTQLRTEHAHSITTSIGLSEPSH